MEHREAFPRILLIVYVSIVAFTTCFGFLGYARFGEDTEGTITLNIPESKELLSIAVKGLLAVSIYFT